MPYREIKPIDMDQVSELYLSGMSAAAIIRELELDCAPSTLIRNLRVNDIDIRGCAQSIPKECPECGSPFIPRGATHKLCLECIPDRAWATRYYNFGITRPKFLSKLEEQKGLCALCGLPLPDNVTKICIDHCHRTKIIRGLLHNRCNLGLHYIEDTEFLSAAINYIEKYKVVG